MILFYYSMTLFSCFFVVLQWDEKKRAQRLQTPIDRRASSALSGKPIKSVDDRPPPLPPPPSRVSGETNERKTSDKKREVAKKSPTRPGICPLTVGLCACVSASVFAVARRIRYPAPAISDCVLSSLLLHSRRRGSSDRTYKLSVGDR